MATYSLFLDSSVLSLSNTPRSPPRNLRCFSGEIISSGALLIPKAAIENVTPTGETHICCGKRLLVVEINLVKNASIPVADVLEQFKARLVSASMKTGGAGGHGAVPSMFEPPKVNFYHQGHIDSRKVRPMSGCFACNQGTCYRQCWDQNGNPYWQYDPVCC